MVDFARKPVRSPVTSFEARSAPRLTDGSDTFSTEKHYSVAELAALWALSEKTIRRMFENEPGVLRWGSEETRFKRAYTTLRIPETVVLRVHRQLRIAG
jgi:hypothetical protein